MGAAVSQINRTKTVSIAMIYGIVLIPKELLRNRVLLEVQDLVCFDSSLLNHHLRPHMLQQLNDAHLNTDSIKVDAAAAKWFIQRNIRVSSLRLNSVAKDLSKLK